MMSPNLRICFLWRTRAEGFKRKAGEDTVGAAHAASLRRAAAEAAEAVGEDHMSAAWRAHRKHVFVLTNAGTLLLAGPGSWHRSNTICPHKCRVVPARAPLFNWIKMQLSPRLPDGLTWAPNMAQVGISILRL